MAHCDLKILRLKKIMEYYEKESISEVLYEVCQRINEISKSTENQVETIAKVCHAFGIKYLKLRKGFPFAGLLVERKGLITLSPSRPTLLGGYDALLRDKLLKQKQEISPETISVLSLKERYVMSHEVGHLFFQEAAPETDVREPYKVRTQLGENIKSRSQYGREELLCTYIADYLSGPVNEDVDNFVKPKRETIDSETIFGTEDLEKIINSMNKNQWLYYSVFNNICDKLRRIDKDEHILALAGRYTKYTFPKGQDHNRLDKYVVDESELDKKGWYWRFMPIFGASFWARWFGCFVPKTKRLITCNHEKNFESMYPMVQPVSIIKELLENKNTDDHLFGHFPEIMGYAFNKYPLLLVNEESIGEIDTIDKIVHVSKRLEKGNMKQVNYSKGIHLLHFTLNKEFISKNIEKANDNILSAWY
ncbi:hypothetical protein GF336_04820 [Candidatus Woesearchaeota archaeon]|nr:hypothetical protein [Candidatus Woesearchaeota archaeon]